MKFTPIVTGSVSLKHAFLHPTPGIWGRIKLLLPGRWERPVPLGGWLIEHQGRRVLVDTGETANVKDLPFSRYHVTAADELPHALASLGLTVDDIDEALLTHLHSDHVDGSKHLRCPVKVHRAEWDFAHSRLGRIVQWLSRMKLPTGIDYHLIDLTDGAFGAFAASKRLTEDGRLLAVATPGHTPGHIAILAIDDEGRHVLFAGDATDSLEQLNARRPDAIGRDPKLTIETIDRIHAHGRRYPTVFVPAHDPQSPSRLAARTTL
jgi:N-acyl homoserine lactone hydrolase